MRYYLILLFCFLTTYNFSQEIDHIDINEINKGFRAPDSLIQLSYKELMEHFDTAVNYPENAYGPDMDTLWATALAKTYIEKARRNKDSVKIGRGYERLSRVSDLDLKYVDTCIFFTKNSEHNNYPTVCYMLKTGSLLKLAKNKEALNTAFSAYELAKEKGYESYIHLLKDYINYINLNWGNRQDGIKGIKEDLKNIKKAGYFDNSQLNSASGKYYYIDGIYSIALAYLELNRYLKNRNDTTNHYALNRSTVYEGLILNKLNHQEEAIAQIKYTDSSLYQITDDEFEELTEGYKLLIDHYKETGDETNQLLYLNKLIKLDSVITSNYITTNAAITINYTIPELEREKQETISHLEAKNQQAGWGLWGLGGGLLVALGIGGYYFKTQRQYKKRFKAVVEISKTIKEETLVETPLPSKTQENPLDPELVQRLDQAIKTFEEEERFTATKITQKSLAEELNTNSAYLSRYINQYKGKNFAQYLIDLRINYVIQRLQTDKVLRSYTVDAIAEECGFGNTKSFTRAFKAATGINPSYFIRNLDKEYVA